VTAFSRKVALAAVVAVLGACQTDIDAGIESANDLMYQKQYVEAERLYRKLLKRVENQGNLSEEAETQRLMVLDRLGRINALYLHDFNQAISDYSMLVRLYPKSDDAFAARATVADIYQHKLDDRTKAIDEFQKLVTEFPNRAETRWAQLQITQAYFQLKNYEQARTEADVLINRWPESKEAAQARFQIANSYHVQNRFTEAIATYERLLETDPEASLASLVLFELGNCFQELDEANRALAYYYACLPDHPNPFLVQRKIRRVRQRLRHTKPSAFAVHMPAYLQKRLARHSASANAFLPVRVAAPAPTPPAPKTSTAPAAPAAAAQPTTAEAKPTPTPTAPVEPAAAPTPAAKPKAEPKAAPAPQPTPAKKPVVPNPAEAEPVTDPQP